MTESFHLIHERVDDIPLLIGLAHRLKVAEVLDRHLGSHHRHQGLSNGTLAAVVLAFILPEGDDTKSTVRDWVARHRRTLSPPLQQPLSENDFTDDRLG